MLQHRVSHMMQEEKSFSLCRHKCKLVPLVRSQMFTCGIGLLLTFSFSIPMWLPWRSELRATPGVQGLHLVVWNCSHNEIILFRTWRVTDHPWLFRGVTWWTFGGLSKKQAAVVEEDSWILRFNTWLFVFSLNTKKKSIMHLPTAWKWDSGINSLSLESPTASFRLVPCARITFVQDTNSQQ